MLLLMMMMMLAVIAKAGLAANRALRINITAILVATTTHHAGLSEASRAADGRWLMARSGQ